MSSSLTNFLASNLHICQIIGDFVILNPPRNIFWLPSIIFPSLRLYKEIDTMQYLKCIIQCLYQFIFRLDQFLDFKLTYVSNYWRFCYFDPSMGHFLDSQALFSPLLGYINKILTLWSAWTGLKCIINVCTNLFSSLTNF